MWTVYDTKSLHAQANMQIYAEMGDFFAKKTLNMGYGFAGKKNP